MLPVCSLCEIAIGEYYVALGGNYYHTSCWEQQKSAKPMQNYQDYQSSDGQPIQMCAIHELLDNGDRSFAMSTIGGIAVCKEHLFIVAQKMVDGFTSTEFLKEVVNGRSVPKGHDSNSPCSCGYGLLKDHYKTH